MEVRFYHPQFANEDEVQTSDLLGITKPVVVIATELYMLDDRL